MRALLFSLALLAGCTHHECNTDDPGHCTNNAAYNCNGNGFDDGNSGSHWDVMQCASDQVCVVPEFESAWAFCAYSDVMGICAGHRDHDVICLPDGSEQACQDGYPTAPVASHCPPGLCHPDIAQCLALPAAQPACGPRQTYSYPPLPLHICIGDSLYSCTGDNYVYDEVACGAGLCADNGRDAACVVSQSPDPRCYFDGNVSWEHDTCSPDMQFSVKCLDDKLITATPCAAGMPCNRDMCGD